MQSNPGATMTFGTLSVGSRTAVHLGSDPTAKTYVEPLSSSQDRMQWGRAYLVVDPADDEPAVGYARAQRAGFVSRARPPAVESPAPLTNQGQFQGPSVHIGYDSSGGDMPGMPINFNGSIGWRACWAKCNATTSCKGWAASTHPGCDGPRIQCWLKSEYLPSPPVPNQCRIYGEQAGVRPDPSDTLVLAVSRSLGAVAAGGSAAAKVTLAIDEIGAIDWFGEFCPPYWRRALPVGNLSHPVAMLDQAFQQYQAVRAACDRFDAKTAAELAAAGGDKYASIAQLTYRQVLGAMQLVWMPSKNTPWYFLKEISSGGCLNTADVVYPAFPQLLYYSPELLRLMQISHLEYAMNFTSQPYPLPWAPHHLGSWPIANLPYTAQENMPLEETSWDILSIAAIAQLQGDDLSWLVPYWPVVQTWFNFMKDLLPFPEEQLSTDDFDGPLYNATNLAVKGIAAIAAYGYIVETFTGNKTAAADAYAMAATYGNTMVQFSWLRDGDDSHFLIGYFDSKKDGGNHSSWPMLYNALWLRLLGYDTLLPNQTALLEQMRDWYEAKKLNEFGLPLNSRKLYTKDDWMTFMAATFYNDEPEPGPSALSATLFERFYAWSNVTTSRQPISDWTNTDSPTAVGFGARPVYGAMWAPMLVRHQQELGLGTARTTALATAVFAEVHQLAQATNVEWPHCAHNGDENCSLLAAWRSKHGATPRG